MFVHLAAKHVDSGTVKFPIFLIDKHVGYLKTKMKKIPRLFVTYTRPFK